MLYPKFLSIIRQPTCVLNETQLTTNINLVYISAPGFQPRGRPPEDCSPVPKHVRD